MESRVLVIEGEPALRESISRILNPQAGALYRQALAYFHERGDKVGSAYVLEGLAGLAGVQRQAEGAAVRNVGTGRRQAARMPRLSGKRVIPAQAGI